MEFRNPNFGQVKGVRYVAGDGLGYYYAGIFENRVVINVVRFRLFGYSMVDMYDNLQNPNEELLAHMNDMRNWK